MEAWYQKDKWNLMLNCNWRFASKVNYRIIKNSGAKPLPTIKRRSHDLLLNLFQNWTVNISMELWNLSHTPIANPRVSRMWWYLSCHSDRLDNSFWMYLHKVVWINDNMLRGQGVLHFSEICFLVVSDRGYRIYQMPLVSWKILFLAKVITGWRPALQFNWIAYSIFNRVPWK